MIKPFLGFLLFSILCCNWISCTLEEDFLTDSNLTVAFSTDTLRFDTVFTEVGSTTRSFKIYNEFNQPLNLKSVRIDNDAGGNFRINVDGRPGLEVNDIFVPPNDSIYVFVEVTIDPDQDISVSPFVFESRVLVQATEQTQVVVLEAFGQNANYIPRNRTRANFSILSCDLGEVVFDDPKPYILYGSLIVDSCTLTLPPGTRLFIHGGLVQSQEFGIFNDGILAVQGAGRLNIDGTSEDPVIIATDRQEEEFQMRSGQYSGIRLGAFSGPHRISHAQIRNGIVGVFVDSLATLNIDHTEISYTSSAGIIGYAANVNASNVALHSNGGGALQAILGGNYELDYCTFVNYNSRSPAVFLSNGFQFSNELSFVLNLNASIRNSIIFGSLGDELALSDFTRPGLFNYSISNSIIKRRDLATLRPEFDDLCVDCYFPASTEPLFANVTLDSFQLDTLSVAEGKAMPLPQIEDDILGNLRDENMPDIGAYEYQHD